jgi:hypothetical protein
MTEPRVFICQVCHHTLDLLTNEDGATYFHTMQDDTGDHEPVPVLANEEWAPRCDFCNVDAVAYRLPARDFEVPGIPVELPLHQSTGPWAACEDCAHLIEADKWADVLRRAATNSADRGRPWPREIRIMTWALYSALRENITGPLKPVP